VVPSGCAQSAALAALVRGNAATVAQVSQMLWAAQGVSDERGRRTAPSAGALYPLELFLVAGNVAGLPSGVYRYRPTGHDLLLVVPGDRRPEIASACRQGG
jgi:SagB-type dehydrogenase family enzyme